jgi:type I restriction enzyme, R subunit
MDVEFYVDDGTIRGDKVRLIDFDAPKTMTAWRSTSSPSSKTRRPDVVIFVNGLPLGVIEVRYPRQSRGLACEPLKAA